MRTEKETAALAEKVVHEINIRGRLMDDDQRSELITKICNDKKISEKYIRAILKG